MLIVLIIVELMGRVMGYQVWRLVRVIDHHLRLVVAPMPKQVPRLMQTFLEVVLAFVVICELTSSVVI